MRLSTFFATAILLVASTSLNGGRTANAEADAKKVEKQVKKAVSKIFKKYPNTKASDRSYTQTKKQKRMLQ